MKARPRFNFSQIAARFLSSAEARKASARRAPRAARTPEFKDFRRPLPKPRQKINFWPLLLFSADGALLLLAPFNKATAKMSSSQMRALAATGDLFRNWRAIEQKFSF